MSTYFPKGQEIQRKWYLVDATGVPVGRLSTAVAEVLMGKTKPTWTPFLDTGDHVVITEDSVAIVKKIAAVPPNAVMISDEPLRRPRICASMRDSISPMKNVDAGRKAPIPP